MNVFWMIVAAAALGLVVVLLWRRQARIAEPPGLPAGLRRIYTNHARERMTQRRIDQDQVELALARPDRLDRDDKQDSMRFEKDYESFTLKVWITADPWPPTDQVIIKTTAATHFATVTIPRDAVGRVIGRKGATVQGVRETSGAKIDVRDGGAVHIRGDSRKSVELAQQMIADIADNKRPR